MGGGEGADETVQCGTCSMIHVGGARVTSNTDNTVKIRDRITWTVAFLLLFCIVSFMVDYNDE